MLRYLQKALGIPLETRSRLRARKFLLGTRSAASVQKSRLLELIRKHQSSRFGRDHGFSEIRTVADYQKRVPIRDYEGHEPYIAEVREGRTEALFGPGTEVLMFAKTSGTTARPKTIPVTRESLAAYREGWTIWGILAFDAHHEIIRLGLKPILQMAGDWRESTTPSGLPCGAITGLTSHMQNPLVRITYCMPPATTRIHDIESKYYMALRLSAYRDLGAAIAANPSTLLGIARLGDREKETLIRDIADGAIDPKWSIPDDVKRAVRLRTSPQRRRTARRLEAIANRTGRLLPKDYWPELDFLANWTGGTMGAYLKRYPEYFGERPIRDVGLIASEGRMTIPVSDGTPAGILDYEHAFFEFIPEDDIGAEDPSVVLANELIEGRRYYIVITNSSGLYRYHIHDLIKCTGFEGEAPLLEFLNKGAHFSSMTGEKLSEFQVVSAVGHALAEMGRTVAGYLLLPTWDDPPYYSLLAEVADFSQEAAGVEFAALVESRLRGLNDEYDNRRVTQRLGPIRLRRLKAESWREFQARRLMKSGGTVEQYKQPCLLPDLDAIGTFAFADEPAAAGAAEGQATSRSGLRG